MGFRIIGPGEGLYHCFGCLGLADGVCDWAKGGEWGLDYNVGIRVYAETE